MFLQEQPAPWKKTMMFDTHKFLKFKSDNFMRNWLMSVPFQEYTIDLRRYTFGWMTDSDRLSLTGGENWTGLH